MRLHISLSVFDLDQAISYYSALFDHSPTVVREGYAKWMLEDPKVNFVVDARCSGGGVDHLGLQAETQEELPVITDRMKRAGGTYVDVDKVQCCFANMDKAWTRGVAGEKWEGFFTHDQNETSYGEDTDHLLDEYEADRIGV